MICRVDALKNFVEFTGKQLPWKSMFKEQQAVIIERHHRYFSGNFASFPDQFFLNTSGKSPLRRYTYLKRPIRDIVSLRTVLNVQLSFYQ